MRKKERKLAGGGTRERCRYWKAAFRLLGWSEAIAAGALGTSTSRYERRGSGSEQMAFADYMTLTSMIGVAAAQAMKSCDAIADLAAAAETLGVRSRE